MTKEFLEKCLSEGLSLAQIGEQVGLEKSTVSYHLKKYGLKPVNQGRAAKRGALEKSTLAALVAEGLNLTELAARTDRSPSTVRYWLKKHGLWPLSTTVRRQRAREAKERGFKVAELECPRHGPTEFILEGRGACRCKRCRSEAVARRRRKVKLEMVAEAGGRCALCGYDEFLGALHFHHLEPDEKSFGLAQRGITRAIAAVREEAAKCILLCANCHAKVEWGLEARPEEAGGARNGQEEAPGKLGQAA